MELNASKWKKYFSEKKQQYYWHNKETNESTWNDPERAETEPISESGNIAFLFLTYGNPTFADIMQKYVDGHPVFVHPKYEVTHPFFSKHVIKERVETAWGGMSIVEATLALLREAVKAETTEWFVLLSEDVYPIQTIAQLSQFLDSSKPKQSLFYQYSAEPIVGESGVAWKAHQWWVLHRNDVMWLIYTMTHEMKRNVQKIIASLVPVGAYDEMFFLTAFKTYIPNYSFRPARPVYAKFLLDVIVKSPIIWNRLSGLDLCDIPNDSFFIRKVTKYFTINRLPSSNDDLYVVFVGERTDQRKLLTILDSDTTDVIVVAGIPIDKIDPGLIEKSIYVCPIIWKFAYQSFASLTVELEKRKIWSRIVFIDEKFDYTKLTNHESREKVALPLVVPPENAPFNDLFLRKLYTTIEDGHNNKAWVFTRHFSAENFKVGLLFVTNGELDPVWSQYLESAQEHATAFVCGVSTNLPPKVRNVKASENASFIDKIYALLRAAIKHKTIHKFLILTDDCRPLRPFAQFYEMIRANDIDSTFADFHEVFKYDEYPEHFVKHSPYVCFSRKTARMFRADPVTNERNFLSLFSDPNVWSQIHNMPIVHENWSSVYNKIDAIDARIRKEYDKLHLSPDNQAINDQIVQLREEKAILRKSPELYTDKGASAKEYRMAMDSGAFFWRSFPYGAKMQSLVPALKNVERELRFIHITKTAGTTIEELGINNGIFWGRYDDAFRRLTYRLHKGIIDPWHVPTVFFHMHELEKAMRERDLFTVMRNPYDRVISEYFCKWGGNKSKQKDQVDEMNKWIQKKLREVKDKMSKNLFQTGHWVPQYMYLFNRNGESVISANNIVLFERLNEEMDALLRRYGYGFTISGIEPQNIGEKKMGVNDLSRDTVDLIEEIYAKDIQIYRSLVEMRYSAKTKSPKSSVELTPITSQIKSKSKSRESSVELTPIASQIKSKSPVKSKSLESIELTPIDELIARMNLREKSPTPIVVVPSVKEIPVKKRTYKKRAVTTEPEAPVKKRTYKKRAPVQEVQPIAEPTAVEPQPVKKRTYKKKAVAVAEPQEPIAEAILEPVKKRTYKKRAVAIVEPHVEDQANPAPVLEPVKRAYKKRTTTQI